MDSEIVLAAYNYAVQNSVIRPLVVFFASYYQYFLVFLVLMFLFIAGKERRKKNFWVLIQVLAAILLSRGLITELVRFFYHRPRPFVFFNFDPIIFDPTNSFPSGHAAFFFALSAIIFIYHKKLGYFCYLSSILICSARVFAGLHYLSDIAAGIAIGVLCAYLVFGFWPKQKLLI